MMTKAIKNFVRSDSGAVTVDWVVLCAAVVGLAAAITLSMTTSSVNLSDNIAGFMTNWQF